MKPFHFLGRSRATLLCCIGMGFAITADASRVTAGSPPAASAVRTAAQQPRHAQVDESASLRQGTITAVDERRGRIQVQGVWVELARDSTRLVRNGRPAGLDTLKAGEAIRFAVTTDSGNHTVRVIYAP